jgi:hypothetical protein
MSEKTYAILVMGTVERRVIVSGESLAEAEANAYSEWSNLTGGHIGTAESVEAYEVEQDVINSYKEDVMEEYANALEHWANCFRDGTLHDAYANEIAYLLEDKAHDIRGDLKNEQTST